MGQCTFPLADLPEITLSPALTTAVTTSAVTLTTAGIRTLTVTELDSNGNVWASATKTNDVAMGGFTAQPVITLGLNPNYRDRAGVSVPDLLMLWIQIELQSDQPTITIPDLVEFSGDSGKKSLPLLKKAERNKFTL